MGDRIGLKKKWDEIKERKSGNIYSGWWERGNDGVVGERNSETNYKNRKNKNVIRVWFFFILFYFYILVFWFVTEIGRESRESIDF